MGASGLTSFRHQLLVGLGSTRGRAPFVGGERGARAGDCGAGGDWLARELPTLHTGLAWGSGGDDCGRKGPGTGLGRLFVGMGVIAIVAVVVAAGIYYLHFGLGVWAFSREAKDWAEFGNTSAARWAAYSDSWHSSVSLSRLLGSAPTTRRLSRQPIRRLSTHIRWNASRAGKASLPSPRLLKSARNEFVRRWKTLRILPPLYDVYDKTIIDGIVRALTDIPIHEIGTRDAVLALLSLRDQYVFLGVAVQTFIAGPEGDTLLRRALDSVGTDTKAQIALRKDQKALLARNVRQRVDWIGKQYRTLKADMGRSP